MSTLLNCAPQARSAATACAEKPHCGKSGEPFMKSTTGVEEICALIRSTTSIFTLPKPVQRQAYRGAASLNYGAARPNLQGAADTMDTDRLDTPRPPEIPPDMPEQVA